MRVNDLVAFIQARHNIHLSRWLEDHPKPWTKDPILQKYRFCNVYRELDAVTVWVDRHWRHPYRKEEDLWFAMVVARLFNNPATLSSIGFPLPFAPAHIKKIALSMKNDDKRVFNPAYIVSTNGISMDKVDYVLKHILEPLWECRKRLRPQIMEALADYAGRLIKFKGLGSFMVGQIIADLKYVEPLSKAVDWNTWAMSGPGSRRGLNRVCGNPVLGRWKETEWHRILLTLQAQVNPLLEKLEMPPLHAQDLQNCLCEFDKYERVRLGEGYPKQLYKGV